MSRVGWKGREEVTSSAREGGSSPYLVSQERIQAQQRFATWWLLCRSRRLMRARGRPTRLQDIFGSQHERRNQWRCPSGICSRGRRSAAMSLRQTSDCPGAAALRWVFSMCLPCLRSEEHTSELQSHSFISY